MSESLRYQDAGVDIAAWNSVKDTIGNLVASTGNSRVVGKFGQFGGMFDIADLPGMKRPVLVASTDSVGTKVMIAFETGKYASTGFDIVNHCVNDILVMGARPLFFLDYIGTGKLKAETAKEIVSGLAAACRENGCVLIGGETAEMPDLYRENEYDLVGTIVGLVDRDAVIDGRDIEPGDVLVGLRSSGLHTNGYSLARKIVREVGGYAYSDTLPGTDVTFGRVLQEPHRSYLPLHDFMQKKIIKGCAHITGGGFQDNIDRILPSSCDAVVRCDSWVPDPIFEWMRSTGNVETCEMFHTFNMGIGMVVIVSGSHAELMVNAPELAYSKPVIIGTVTAGNGKVILS